MQSESSYINTTPDYADFGKRLVAYLIDALILSVPIGILYGLVIFTLVGSVSASADSGTGQLGAAEAGAAIGSVVLLYILVPIIMIGYFSYFESSEKQASMGKQVMGLKVVGMNGERISFMNAVGRNASRLISSAICAIGYIMAAFTEKKQALHDMIASTLVVNK